MKRKEKISEELLTVVLNPELRPKEITKLTGVSASAIHFHRKKAGMTLKANPRFTEAEKKKLIDLYISGLKIDNIAELLGRSRGGINAQLYKLRLEGHI